MSDAAKTSTCPSCGEPAAGNFCQHCGSSLGGRFCNQCGAKLAVGAKFCNECGGKVAGGGAATSRPRTPAAPAAGAAARGAGDGASPRKEAVAATVGGQNLPWWIAGVAMFLLILVTGLNMVRPGPPAAPNTGGNAAPATVSGSGAPPDLSQMSPLEAADRLFDRVMRSISSGDSAQAQAFMPMAISAYQRARPLSLDGLFHLSMLNRTAMNLEAALDNAVEILDQDPNHLLGLAAAAEASVELGEMDEAAGYYQRIVDIYDSESQRGLEEYQMHSTIVVTLKDDAQSFLDSR